MIQEHKYVFERNKKDPSLFRFKYYSVKSALVKTMPKLWSPWSKWVTLAEMSDELHKKKQSGYAFKLNDLKRIPPGSRKTMHFKKDVSERELYLWNKPTDIGRLRKNRKLSKLVARTVYSFNQEINLDWKKVPLISDDILGNFVAMFNRLSEDSFFSKLNRLAPHLELTQEEKSKYLESKNSGNLPGLLEVLRTPVQLLINDRIEKGNILLKKHIPIDINQNIATIKTKSKKGHHIYRIDIRERTCSCRDFQSIGEFGFFCKHLYAANEKWKNLNE